MLVFLNFLSAIKFGLKNPIDFYLSLVSISILPTFHVNDDDGMTIVGL